MRPVENAELEADKRRLNRPVLNGRCLRAGACWRDAEVVDRRRSGGAALLRLTEEPFRVDGLPVKEPAWRDVAGRDGVVGRMGWVGKAAKNAERTASRPPSGRPARKAPPYPPPTPVPFASRPGTFQVSTLPGSGRPALSPTRPPRFGPSRPSAFRRLPFAVVGFSARVDPVRRVAFTQPCCLQSALMPSLDSSSHARSNHFIRRIAFSHQPRAATPDPDAGPGRVD